LKEIPWFENANLREIAKVEIASVNGPLQPTCFTMPVPEECLRT